ncbi:MAG: AbrB/MazE/SpoVT family DNA-binding domain-containing protein [Candidatus Omnitrophica bacterium]|nr:AbrB/MazE/SpoVT family DNA-binding domain-containing protein [Candidatus Omnitrophota bacterium]
MQKIVSITSQGQITLPASIRRIMGLDFYKKALVKIENKKIIVEPTVDLLSLGGLLKNKAKKKRNINEIIKLEEKAIAKMSK